MPGASLIELRVLESAARLGSLSAAARELRVTQQAVSHRIRTLERLAGVELLRRSPAGATPTPEGDAVLAWARDVLTAADRLDEGLAGLRGSPARALRIVASQTIAAHLLPEWLVELRRAQTRAGSSPDATALRTANSREAIAAVRGGEADLGFVECPDAPHDLGSLPVRRDRMVVAVAPDHTWAARDAVSLAELASIPLVAREEGSGTRDAFERAAARAVGGAPRAPLVTLATEAAVRSAAAQGVAPAVLSELAVRDDVRLGRIRAVPIGPEPLERPLTAVWRGSRRDLAGARRALVAIAAGGTIAAGSGGTTGAGRTTGGTGAARGTDAA
ncbi:LysR family transcriptional regulator [Leucobacter allii]|uniref:LysR family transcriptional regulator n=1 Tax=Leucobacter allii TaxID=2932247 RepID=UPI001FD4E608|nr:LysR family transcriptional regulator [Leucobacter allii]UOR01167.1 LysR family transcriptional regulator [Leucobacter allii]